MGLRCSLLGHDYGEPFVERDREERGNEVVVTERELAECKRCGAEKVSSQNTEVRTLETASDADASPQSSPPSTDSTQTPSSGSSPAQSSEASQSSDAPQTPGSSAAGASSRDADASSPGGASSEASASDAGGAFTSATDVIEQAESDAGSGDAPTEDDAVIIDESGDGEPGSDQWDEPPEEDLDAEPDPAVGDAAEDAEFVEANDGTDAAAGTSAADAPAGDAATGDANRPDSQSTAAASSDSATTGQTRRERGEWPDPDGDDEGFDATPENEQRDGSFQFGDADEAVLESDDAGFTSAGPIDQSGSDDLDFTLYCPECGFEQYAAGSSLRAGDICPECRRGYLAEDS